MKAEGHETARRVARFRIIVVLAAALVLGVCAACVATLARHEGRYPTFGWSAAQRGGAWVVAGVDSAGPAAGLVRVSDRLVSFDGDTLIGQFGPGWFGLTQRIGGTYTLGIERDGRDVTQRLAMGATESWLGTRLIFLVVSFVWCAVGLFIGWSRPDQATARLAFAAAVATGLVYFQVGVYPFPFPGGILQPLHMVLGYHFFYRFPEGVRRGRFSRALLWLFYGWGLATFGIDQSLKWTFFIHGPGATAAWESHHAALLTLSAIAANSMVAPLAIAPVVLMATAYRRADAGMRRRIRWVVIASATSLSPLVLWAAFAVAGAIASPGPSPIPPRLEFIVDLWSNAGTVLIPIGVSYAVVRHRVFDVAVVVRRTMQYLLAKRALQTLLTLPAVTLLIMAVAHRDWTIAQLVTRGAGYLWLIAAIALSLQFREPLGRWLDHRFFREQYSREQVLVGLLGDLRRLSEPADLSRLVRAKVEYAMHPSVARLWFEGDPDPPPEPLLLRIAHEGAGPDAPLTSGAHLPDGISLVVPVVSSEERLAGVLMLGEKRSEEPWSANDLSLLGGIAKEAAVVRENLLLRERISEERRIKTDVLAHLGPDRVNLVKECPACGACYDSAEERCTRDGHELSLSLPVARQVAGRYRLDSLIGRGGMGAVYEALDLRLQRTVAIKFLLGPAFDQEHALRRFQRGARAVARLNHPNIVSVYDYGGLEAHGAYLVMERVHGVTLREELERCGALSGPAAAEWFAPLLDGVAAAHEEGVIHRDLKPENVVRQRPEHGPPVVKILDFGIAKERPLDTASDRLTTTGMVVGTFGYMSPEQLTGRDVDARSDVFSVGVMVVESLTGQWPFRGTTYGELLGSIVLEPYHLPGDAPRVRALDAVLQRCLAKEPRDRFASAAALRHELVPALRDCPALARERTSPPPTP